MKVAKTSVKVCTNWSKVLSEGEGKGKRATSGGSGQICGRLNTIGSANEASTSTHALIMEARGMSSVRGLCSVST